MRGGLVLAAVLFMALGAHAAPAARRPPDQQQTMIDLAYALGEVHALKTVCEGAGAPIWRGRMSRMIEVEAPDEGFKRKLISSFNAGFASRQAEFPTCRPEAEEQGHEAAMRGKNLARRLSGRAP